MFKMVKKKKFIKKSDVIFDDEVSLQVALFGGATIIFLFGIIIWVLILKPWVLVITIIFMLIHLVLPAFWGKEDVWYEEK